jgi:tetratricopeptide (TPR) repeat protein
LGNNFAEPVAAALLGDGAEDLLKQAAEQGILRHETDGRLAFQKEFLRETVYRLQLGDLLRDLHRRCGTVLETLYPDPGRLPGEKAYHFDKALEFGKAGEYFRLAAEEASGEFRNREALAAFDRFLELSPDNLENSRVRLQKARILEHLGDWKGARAELERGIGLAALSGQEDQYHRFFAFQGQIQFKQGDTAGAKLSLEKAIRDPRSVGLGPELVQSRIDLARVHLLLGQYGEALGRLLEAKDLAVEQKFAEEEGLALYYLGVVYRVRNRKTEAIETYQKSLEIFRNLRKDRLITYPLYDLSLMFQHEGALDQAKTFMEDAYRIYTRIGYKSGLAAALLNLGAIEDQRGNFVTAMDAFRRSRNITEELGEDLGTAYALFSLGASAYKQREYPRALATLNDAHVLIERLGAESYKGYTLSYLASVLVRLGRADEAIAHIREQIEVMSKIGDDVEKGRAFLALAELLASGPTLSSQGQTDLREIVARSGAPKASASWFYQAAIRSAREANYINTLIPATYEYGVFLRSRGRSDLGDKAIQQAWSKAVKGGWTAFAERLAAEHPNLLGRDPVEATA